MKSKAARLVRALIVAALLFIPSRGFAFSYLGQDIDIYAFELREIAQQGKVQVCLAMIGFTPAGLAKEEERTQNFIRQGIRPWLDLLIQLPQFPRHDSLAIEFLPTQITPCEVDVSQAQHYTPPAHPAQIAINWYATHDLVAKYDCRATVTNRLPARCTSFARVVVKQIVFDPSGSEGASSDSHFGPAWTIEHEFGHLLGLFDTYAGTPASGTAAGPDSIMRGAPAITDDDRMGIVATVRQMFVPGTVPSCNGVGSPINAYKSDGMGGNVYADPSSLVCAPANFPNTIAAQDPRPHVLIDKVTSTTLTYRYTGFKTAAHCDGYFNGGGLLKLPSQIVPAGNSGARTMTFPVSMHGNFADIACYQSGTYNFIASSNVVITPITDDPCSVLEVSDQNIPITASGLWSCNGAFLLTAQTDGNIVLYGPSGVLWSSHTAGIAGAHTFLQTDGNLVLYNNNYTAAPFRTDSSGNPGAYLHLSNAGDLGLFSANGVLLWRAALQNSELLTGQTMYGGDALWDGGYVLVMQTDGNLVTYGPQGVVWSSNTAGHAGARLVMQGDGNLVVYSWDNKALFNTGTYNLARVYGRLKLKISPIGELYLEAPNGVRAWTISSGGGRYGGSIRGF